MTTEDLLFTRAHDVFQKLIDLAPEDRPAALQRECGVDQALFDRVTALLEMDAKMATGVLTRAFSAAFRNQNRGMPVDLTGNTLGDYKLVSVLGRGGAGTVYLGEPADRRFGSRAAIKVLETAASNELSERFAAEVRILETLKHPNIAQLIDAGESIEHYPYLTMEYVHGETLDRYCDRKRLTNTERLRLFLQVCDAVQYAHQQLVVHRDLKPSNVLVTDGGEVKLLDFGIAKLLSANTPTPALTRLNDRALTPEFASPEQISGRHVTTASDVYSLGIVLYELLTGLPPYSLESKSQLEIERTICHADPLKPSQAVAAASDTENAEHLLLSAGAHARGVSPARLASELLGDLDSIVMRALRKEPEKRYPSVAMLAADICRFLKFEPVAARHGNWHYHFSRYCRRHWMPITAGSVTLVALLISTVVSIDMYRKARVDRDQAEQVAKLMSTVFEGANPYVTNGQEVTAVDLLDTASERLGDLGSDPQVQMLLMFQVGEAYLNIGRYGKASQFLQTALEIERRQQPKDVALRTSMLVKLAGAERGKGSFDSANAHYLEAQSLLAQHHQTTTKEFANLLRAMGRLEHTRGDIKAAEQNYQKSIAIYRGLSDSSVDLAQVLGELAALYNWMDNYAAADRAVTEAISIFSRTLPERHPNRVFAQLIQGEVWAQNGKPEDAARVFEQAVASQRIIYQNNGPQLAKSLKLLAGVKQSLGQFTEAEALLREALDTVRRAFGDSHFETGVCRTSLGRVLLAKHDNLGAEEQLRKALTTFATTLPSNHQYIAAAQYWLGETLLSMKRLDEAIAMLTNARDTWQDSKAPRWRVARTESALGQAHINKGNVTTGESLLRNAYTALLADRGSEDEATELAQQRLVAFDSRARRQSSQ